MHWVPEHAQDTDLAQILASAVVRGNALCGLCGIGEAGCQSLWAEKSTACGGDGPKSRGLEEC